MYITAFWAVVLLLSADSKNKPRKFLGVFMILALGVYLSHAVYFKEQYAAYLYFHPIYLFSSLSVYPMYYWYVRRLTVEHAINYKNLLLFLPAFLIAVMSFCVFLFMTPAERIDYVQHYMYGKKEVSRENVIILMQKGIFIISRLIFMAQVFLFIFLGRKLVLKQNRRIADFYSNTEHRQLRWVSFFLYCFLATSMMSLVFNAIGRSVFNHSSVLLVIPSAIFSVLLFLIGFHCYVQNYFEEELTQEEDQLLVEPTLKEYNQAVLRENLLALFEKENVYRQSDLKITQVAFSLSTNRTYVSNLINSEFKCTFNEFVNQYRIKEAKRMLEDKKNQTYTLDFIADSVGFSSSNSLIRTFKDFENITPGKYREKLLLR